MRFMTSDSIFWDISEIYRDTVPLDNGIVFSSFPYLSPCIMDVILVAARKIRDSPTFKDALGTLKDARNAF
ncbi:hypothetical protein TNCV_1427131 [Trichonephila clavipes]|nr:hypothetical protein TNCV_1427131 [Trichonephila clavipes]